jgi:glycosyltransferase involved in cell wall biosynthesis
MKILYHHRTLGDGAEGIHIREMIRAFRGLGHEVRVIGPVGESAPQTSPKSRRLAAVKRAIPGALFELAEIAYSGYAFCMTLWESLRFRPDFIYERYMAFNVGGVLAGRLGRVPVILEVNAPLALERTTEPDEKLIFRGLATRMERWAPAHATCAVVVSTPLKTYLESIGVPVGKCTVMPNGVDPVRFMPREKDPTLMSQTGIRPDQIVVGFTGVLRPWHGLDLLLQAIAAMAAGGLPVFLLVVGDGPYRKPLERLVGELGLKDRVAVTGRIAHDRVPDYVALFDIAVSPRATFYASPMKVIEYMALGKPVVVPRTPNFLDFIDDGVNGATFADGDADELARTLMTLCRSPDLRATLGLKARQKVEARLNWRWNAEAACRLCGVRAS